MFLCTDPAGGLNGFLRFNFASGHVRQEGPMDSVGSVLRAYVIFNNNCNLFE